jgi:DNA modification methylase
MTDSDWTNSVLTGDVRDRLADLPASSVHCVMTSPPYFGLRNYNHEDQIGLEESLDEYIRELVAVGDDLRRVLRDDGSWWLNLGDSYGDNKQKLLVPHRVAIALQEDGWTVRNDVTWVKPAPMPQSVKDRLNTTTEQVFHLTPRPDYWYDLDAIREPHAESSHERMASDAPVKPTPQRVLEQAHAQSGGVNEDGDLHSAGKNPGDVFEVTTKPFPDAHFAVYPPELCEKPLKASCPPQVCADCGAPYEREVEEKPRELPDSGRVWDEMSGQYRTVESVKRIEDKNTGGGTRRNGDPVTAIGTDREFKGWRQTCDCDTDDTEPGIVLDPFAGAGTTLLKAKELGRRFVGIELNPEYADMARARVGLAPHEPAHVRDDDAQQGFEAYTDGGGSE